ncbi:tetratricopeptide repeat protein [Nocardia sp. NPDC056000]|uniref:SEL1-like repeat protein n=1 Tax=Nocardia sp. NPDC056000 TaxID=3345674 RepID=UPI0035D634C5
MAESDPYLLGVTPSAFGEIGLYGQRDPYVARTRNEVDARLASAMVDGSFVLVTGSSKAGKTRTLFEAVRAHLPAARLLAPTPGSLSQLAAHPELAESYGQIVVWLDDLDRFLTHVDPVTPAILARLTARQEHTVVVATLRLEARDRLRRNTGELTRDIRILLGSAVAIELGSTSEDDQEQTAAVAAYPDQELGKHGLGEALAGAPELLARYRDSCYSSPPLFAAIRIAIDWVRVGRPDPIPEPVLVELATELAGRLHPEAEITKQQIHAAISDARTPPVGAGRVAALSTIRLGSHARGYRPFDYLVAWDDGQQHAARPISDAFWYSAAESADLANLFAIGLAARQRGRVTVASRLFRTAAEGGLLEAMYVLGVLCHERGDDSEAERWYRRAANADFDKAMLALGALIERRRDYDGAEEWYRRAANLGNTSAMKRLGSLLQRYDDVNSADDWYRRAARVGDLRAATFLIVKNGLRWLHSDLDDQANADDDTSHRDNTDRDDLTAMLDLGELVRLQRANRREPTTAVRTLSALVESRRSRGVDLAEKEVRLQQTAADGDLVAMRELACLAVDRDDLDEAEFWFRRAAENGGESEFLDLGTFLDLQRGDSAEAGVWQRKAGEAGSLVGNVYIQISEERGEHTEAEHRLRRESDAGNSTAMVNLGDLFQEQGKLADAEISYYKAADRGDLVGMLRLVFLLHQRDGLGEAEARYRRRAELDDPIAMSNLGAICEQRQDAEGALRWYRQAAEHGIAYAMLRIWALLETVFEDPVEAEPWLRLAAEADIKDAIYLLASKLDRRGDIVEAEYWYCKAAESGDSLAKYRLRELLEQRGDSMDAEKWRRKMEDD